MSIGLITREHAISAAQNAMKNQGYAVAVHGSRVRDLDLIIADAIPGTIIGKPEKKSHGRVGFTIHPLASMQYGFDRWYIDLSVMPRKRSRK